MSALAASLGKISGAVAGESSATSELNPWLDRLYNNAVKLKTREISALQWQETMDRLYADGSLGQLKERLDS